LRPRRFALSFARRTAAAVARSALLVAANAPPASLARRFARGVVGFSRGSGVGLSCFARQRLGPRNALADQLFDLGDSPAVAGADDGVGRAGLAGAAGAADAVHVVVGMMGNVEIED